MSCRGVNERGVKRDWENLSLEWPGMVYKLKFSKSENKKEWSNLWQEIEFRFRCVGFFKSAAMGPNCTGRSHPGIRISKEIRSPVTSKHESGSWRSIGSPQRTAHSYVRGLVSSGFFLVAPNVLMRIPIHSQLIRVHSSELGPKMADTHSVLYSKYFILHSPYPLSRVAQG